MEPLKNLIFDLGGVLIEYRWRDFLRDLGAPEQRLDLIGSEMFEDPRHLWHEFDLGNYTEEELIAEFAKEFPEDISYIASFVRHGEYMHVPRVDVWERVHLLKEKGYRLYLLSNYPESLFRKHTQYADFMKDLDGRVVSYEICLGKPEMGIYQALLDKYALNPKESIFFDDRADNVRGAEACGIPSRLVYSKESLLEDLDALLAGEEERVRSSDGLEKESQQEDSERDLPGGHPKR